jgi:hypothetical protein
VRRAPLCARSETDEDAARKRVLLALRTEARPEREKGNPIPRSLSESRSVNVRTRQRGSPLRAARPMFREFVR